MDRDAQVVTLLALLQRAKQGSGSTVLIMGEAGIGKTRLAEELAAAARGEDVLVAWGRCYEGDGAPAFWPWLQMLRSLMRQLESPEGTAALHKAAPVVVQILPELRDLFPQLTETSTIGPEQARFRLFETISRLIIDQAALRPLVLIVDDLHWADEASLRLTEFVSRDVETGRVLLVVTCRDVELGWRHPLTHTLAALARQRTQRIELRGLEHEALNELMTAWTGAVAQPALVDAIEAATDGNPFFTTEIVRLLAAEGRLTSPGSSLGIPPSVRDVIGRRLSHVSETAASALLAAAVLGRDVPIDVLAQVVEGSSRPTAQLIGALEEALAARLIVEHGRSAGRFSFSHALVRETLYELIGSAPRRAQLHQRCGEAIEALYASHLDAHYAELAHHFLAAGEPAKGVAFARMAGEQALGQLAYEEAIACFERALDALRAKRGTSAALGRERGDLLFALGTAQSHAGNLEAAEGTFREVARLARSDGAADLLARAAIGFGGPTESAVRDQIFNSALLSEALQNLEPTDSPLRATVLSRLAWALMTMGPQEQAEDVSQNALAMARRLGDPPTLVNALYGRLAALLGPYRTEERLAIGTELGRLGAQTGDLGRAVRGHSFRLFALLEMGDLEGAAQAHADYDHCSQELRLPMYRHAALLRPAAFEVFRGRFDNGERMLRQARAGLERVGYPVAAQIYVLIMLMAWADRDPLNSPLEAELAQLDDHPFCVRLMPSALAYMQAETGRQGAARRLFEKLAADEFAWLARDRRNWLPSAAFCALICVVLGDKARAATLYELMRPFAAHNVTLHGHGHLRPRSALPRCACGNVGALERGRHALRGRADDVYPNGRAAESGADSLRPGGSPPGSVGRCRASRAGAPAELLRDRQYAAPRQRRRTDRYSQPGGSHRFVRNGPGGSGRTVKRGRQLHHWSDDREIGRTPERWTGVLRRHDRIRGALHQHRVAHADQCPGGRRRAAGHDLRVGGQRRRLRPRRRERPWHGNVECPEPGRWRERNGYLSRAGRQSNHAAGHRHPELRRRATNRGRAAGAIQSHHSPGGPTAPQLDADSTPHVDAYPFDPQLLPWPGADGRPAHTDARRHSPATTDRQRHAEHTDARYTDARPRAIGHSNAIGCAIA